MKNENGEAAVIIAVIVFTIMSGFVWLMLFGGALYPEDRTITVDSVDYHSHVTSTAWNDASEVTGTYTEIRITASDGSEYEYSPGKHIDNPMYANIGNGWTFPRGQTIESGGRYRITLWHSIYMGSYVRDGFSNWNPNPEISKIVRID